MRISSVISMPSNGKPLCPISFSSSMLQEAISIKLVRPIRSGLRRINKGVDKGVDKVSAYIKEMYRKYGAKSYVLKCDVSKYFQSIDKSILRGLIFKKIRCRETRWLVDKVLNSTEGKTGIPVGNLTSQLFANIYLHELDVFVKEKLHVKRYARYMDDFVILSDDKQYLHRLWKIIESFLSRWLHLKLNPKTAIFPITQGVDFLGYRIFAHRKLLRKQYVKRSKRMINNMIKFFKHVKGRFKSFYTPSWVNDFEIAFDIKNKTNYINVELSEMYRYYLNNGRKKKIVIFTKGYKSYIADIMSYSYDTINDKDYGRLVLATSFPVYIRKEDVCMISFFNLVRLDSDEMTINFETVDVATVELVMKEVDDLL